MYIYIICICILYIYIYVYTYIHIYIYTVIISQLDSLATFAYYNSLIRLAYKGSYSVS